MRNIFKSILIMTSGFLILVLPAISNISLLTSQQLQLMILPLIGLILFIVGFMHMREGICEKEQI